MTVDAEIDIFTNDMPFTVDNLAKLKHIQFFANLHNFSVDMEKECLFFDFPDGNYNEKVVRVPNPEVDAEEEMIRSKLRELTIIKDKIMKEKLGHCPWPKSLFANTGICPEQDEEDDDDEDEQDPEDDQDEQDDQADQDDQDDQDEED